MAGWNGPSWLPYFTPSLILFNCRILMNLIYTTAICIIGHAHLRPAACTIAAATVFYVVDDGGCFD